MVKHIVSFKMKAFDTPEQKEAKLNEIKAELEALVTKIEVLKSMEVGINANPAEAFDFCLVSEFETMEEVDIYAKHPEHVAVAVKIREHLESRACVDYYI
jgi:hypothetical protein